MRISVIGSDLSGGGTLACLSLARALQSHFDVRIVGTCFGRGLWTGCAHADIPVDPFPARPLPAYLSVMSQMSSSIESDIVIAHQLRLSSFGTALLHRFRTGTPVALYLDDDDIELTRPGRSQRLDRRLRNVNGDLPTRLMYRLRNRADVIFCGSEYFSQKFGGVTVRLGRDPEIYDVAHIDREEVRSRIGFCDRDVVIGFMGNPRPHVGIQDLTRALEILDDPDFLLLVVPPGDSNEYTRQLLAKTTSRMQVIENRPSGEIPELLAASDIVVVPQRTESYSLGQLPARLVEAMAMAKPIITTPIGDVPVLLKDSAIFIEDRSPEQLADALAWMKSNMKEATMLGQKARQIFLKELTAERMASILVPKLRQILRSRNS